MLPDLDAAAAQGWNVFLWAFDQRVPDALKMTLYGAIFLSQILCGLATVTSTSRMIFAFSRDGGLPFSPRLAKVSIRYRTPAAAIWVGAVLSVLFVWGAKYLEAGGTPVYTVVVSCTVIFLFFSFVIPITLGLFAYGGAKWPVMGPWNLGRGLYSVFAVLSVAAMALIVYLGVQPPNGLARHIVLGFLLVTAVVWLGFENRRFTGPPIGADIARRRADIARAEAAFKLPA